MTKQARAATRRETSFETTKLKAARPGGTVRISVPAAVAYDLGSFQKTMGVIAERLGCRACFSGSDCVFQLERDWVINERLEARAVSLHLPQDPIPDRRVTATLARSVSFDLDRMQKAVANIAGRLGCAACCSGFDILFRNELDFVIDENLNVLTRGAGF